MNYCTSLNTKGYQRVMLTSLFILLCSLLQNKAFSSDAFLINNIKGETQIVVKGGLYKYFWPAGFGETLNNDSIYPDQDGDGINDWVDIDDDNDGILDVVEACGSGATDFSCLPGGKDPSAYSILDSIPNYKNAKYCTLNTRGVCNTLDKDADGIINLYDLDADNDGIPDLIETGGVDADGDGRVDSATDNDGDGLADEYYKENNIPLTDSDNDNIPDYLDLDADNDGLPDLVEAGGVDADGDGRVDDINPESGQLNTDADGDGFTDLYDPDKDGIPGHESVTAPLVLAQDLSSDGIPEVFTDGDHISLNNDEDLRPGWIDLDADDDGIPDLVESGGADVNNDGMVDNFTFDQDGDGFSGFYDTDGNNDFAFLDTEDTGTPLITFNRDANGDGKAREGYVNGDTDGDGILDNLDLDADNDGVPDLIEVGGIDANGDGMVDAMRDFTTGDIDNDGWADILDGSSADR